MNLKRVVVTGLGAITPIGNDVPTTWDNAVKGVSGAGPITHFDASKFKTQFACEVKNFNASDFFDRKELRKFDLYSQYAIVAAEQAIKEAHEDPVTELSEEVLQGYREQLENVSKDYLSNGLIDDIANEVVERIGECQCGDVAKMTTDELKAMIRTIMSEMKEEISKGEANWLSITHHSMSENGNIIGG